MLEKRYLRSVVWALRARGVWVSRGLKERELQRVEEVLGTALPPDLRSFLAFAMPRGERFPNWRDPSSEAIAQRLAWPADGICFDIERNAFWLQEWGPRPGDLDEAKAVAREHVARAPLLIPIFAHRYLPARPCLAGNPVFSVYQTDIIFYGHDLPSYLENEFGVRNPYPTPATPRGIELWTRLAYLD